MLSDINVKGTNHEIGGAVADGQWVSNLVTVFSSVNFSATGTSTYTVSNYLPDDDNTYEVMVIGYAATGTSSGCASNWWVMDSNSDYSQSIGYCLTRTNSNVASGNSGILPLKQVGGVLTITINVTGIGSGTTTGNSLYLSGYRRIGTNG